ncbi:hypothetical protein [Haladaptatus caseinilyticus]|uniref:hypothetical protein n=1 Tax=Haladaptatus caseinilyticus TaxID=2993314 RepID=UPI00224A7AF5|nr:hypothetical protein [Haladaptatus caseinilyticus]
MSSTVEVPALRIHGANEYDRPFITVKVTMMRLRGGFDYSPAPTERSSTERWNPVEIRSATTMRETGRCWKIGGIVVT